jgi:N-acetylglucosaminyldiphosphoundecaprenol N-acetyl-beta-D-mannosaminyltransferase
MLTESRRSGSDLLDVFGLPLSPVESLDGALAFVAGALRHPSGAACLVTFVNPLGIKLLRSARGYSETLRRMDAVFCDGIALVLAARRVGRFPLERISFDSTSLAPPVFALAREHGKTVAIVGGQPGVADVAANRIRDAYPGIRILAALDGFQPTEVLLERLTQLDPDIVICGMGAPRQESFLIALADTGWSGVGFTCGGYLDHLGERFNFYPAIVDRLNLRWLYRLRREPRRIGYRFLVEYAPFWRAVVRQAFSSTRRPVRAEVHS